MQCELFTWLMHLDRLACPTFIQGGCWPMYNGWSRYINICGKQDWVNHSWWSQQGWGFSPGSIKWWSWDWEHMIRVHARAWVSRGVVDTSGGCQWWMRMDMFWLKIFPCSCNNFYSGWNMLGLIIISNNILYWEGFDADDYDAIYAILTGQITWFCWFRQMPLSAFS